MLRENRISLQESVSFLLENAFFVKRGIFPQENPVLCKLLWGSQES